MERKDILLFSLHPDYPLGKNLSADLDIPMSPVEINHFADGEIFAKPLVSVRNKVVIVIQSLCTPVNERVMELLIFTSACKLNGAKEVILVSPYVPYSRQDRIINEGDPISAKLFADLLSSAGVDTLISVDLHNASIPAYFNFPVINLNPLPLLAKNYKEILEEKGIQLPDLCIVSPDKGSINRAKVFSSLLPGSTVAYMDKYRPSPNHALIKDLHGDVDGKYCLIVDDLIDTGGTVMACSTCLKEHNSKDIFVGATHGLFSNQAIQNLYSASISSLVISDSLDVHHDEIEKYTLSPLYAMYLKDYLYLD